MMDERFFTPKHLRSHNPRYKGLQPTFLWLLLLLLLLLLFLHLPLPPQTDNLKCKLCPKNWMLYENKCYWTSDEKQTWNKSQNICAAKNSQLAVFHNKEELGCCFLHHENNPLSKQLEVTGPAQANSCGMLKLNKVILEACTAVTKWICEKDALLL
uniref:Uncharacterized protein n=1 Tax=Varanus komodoensis TaxID=61221 RepID=A0A8D2J5S0_VARKO